MAFLSLAGVMIEKVFAAGGGGTNIVFPNPLGANASFISIANRIIDGITTLAIPIVGIMVVWGGLQIITAGGEPEKFKNGRQTILYAVIGFAVILLAKGIVIIIQNLLTG